MIKYLESGKNFCDRGLGYSTNYNEISENEYTRLRNMSEAERSAEIYFSISEAIKYGYGYYGYHLIEKNGEYYLGISSGNSCD